MTSLYVLYINSLSRGAWLAQSEENESLDLGVVSSSLTVDVEITEKKNKLKKKGLKLTLYQI